MPESCQNCEMLHDKKSHVKVTKFGSIMVVTFYSKISIVVESGPIKNMLRVITHIHAML